MTFARVLFFPAALGAAIALYYFESRYLLTWRMLDVNRAHQQADAHLLQFPDGAFVMIDAARDADQILPCLEAHRVQHLEKVIISHAHKDHYGGLLAIVESGISIGEVIFNLPDRPTCERERGWGCDYEDVLATRAVLQKRGIPVREVKPGDEVLTKGRVRLEVLHAYDGRNTPVGPTDINDTSVIIIMTVGGSRVLLPGDLNDELGKWLAANEPRVRADVLKVPHHGGESLAPNVFFDRVGARLALVPGPRWLWRGGRAERTREYFRAKGVPVYVNGYAGEVSVTFFDHGFFARGRFGWPRWFSASSTP